MDRIYPVHSTPLCRCMALGLLLLLSGCFKPEHLKTVSWNNHEIEWSVVDGGATTSFLWKIHYKKWSGKKLIFQSYADPYIQDIAVIGDYLLIYCQDSRFLYIPLDKIEDYVDHPVKYSRLALEQTNASYEEPGFIKSERKKLIKWGLIK